MENKKVVKPDLSSLREEIIKHLPEVKNQRRPFYHFSAPIGWMNDPNGFGYFDGSYQIFYQNHPFESADTNTEAGWGHAISKDLLNFENLPVALTPEYSYEKNGCWSGSSVQRNGMIYLFYTGNRLDEKNITHQCQCLAVSKDGINFEKYEKNPVIPASLLPEGVSEVDFRDPCVFQKGGKYCLICGSHTDSEAVILLFTSHDLLNWSKGKIIFSSPKFGTMIECPNYFEINGQGILMFSAQNIQPQDDSFWNVSSSLWVFVDLDINKGCLVFKSEPAEIDYGLDFYAPQTRTIGGRTLMLSWMQMWGRRNPMIVDGLGWGSEFALTRELSIENGRLIQSPVQGLDALFEEGEHFTLDRQKTSLLIRDGEVSHLTLEADLTKRGSFCIDFYQGKGQKATLAFEPGESTLSFDRRNGGFVFSGVDPSLAKEGYRFIRLPKDGKKLSLDCYLDVNSVEIFINHGEATLTCLVYNDKDARDISIQTTGGLPMSGVFRRKKQK